MMLSQYTINEGTRQEREAQELAEFTELVTRLNYFIIRISGSFAAAVELLEKHGIESRLDIEELELAGPPTDLLADLLHLGNYLDMIREEHDLHDSKDAEKKDC